MPIELTHVAFGATDHEIQENLDKAKAEWASKGYYVTVESLKSGNFPTAETNPDGTTVNKPGQEAVINLYTVTDFLLGVGKQAVQTQDEIFNAEFKNQVEQLQALKDINTVLDAVNTAKANGTQLSEANQTLLEKLKTEGKITYDETWKLGDLDAAKLETLRGNLTTAQSSQSATNEEASMKLNEAANARSAIFTQLHTLLQTMMSLNQNLARW